MPPKKYTKEDFVQNRKDVQDLSAAVDNLTKKQEGFFAALTTSGDKFKEIVDTSKALSKSLSESTKRTEENNDLAENQSKIAKLGISLGDTMLTVVHSLVFMVVLFYSIRVVVMYT